MLRDVGKQRYEEAKLTGERQCPWGKCAAGECYHDMWGRDTRIYRQIEGGRSRTSDDEGKAFRAENPRPQRVGGVEVTDDTPDDLIQEARGRRR
jgi:hypothetical protein